MYGPDAEVGKGGAALVEVGAVEFFQDDAVGVTPVARVEGGQALFGVETGGAEVAVDPFQGDGVAEVGSMSSRRFEPASDVAVREIRSRASHGVSGTFPRGAVSLCVDDDIGVSVEDEDGAVGRSKGEEFRPSAEGAQALIWDAGAELTGDRHGVTQRPTGDQSQLEAGVEGQHPGGLGAAEGVSRHTDALPVDVVPGEEEIDAPHRVEDELAHDEPAGPIGAGVNLFGVVRPGTHVAADVTLFFSDRVENQAGQSEFGVELGDVGVLPLAFAAAVAAGDYDGRHGGAGVCGSIEYGGDAGTGFTRPDPFFDDDSIPFDLSAGLRRQVAAYRRDAQEVVQSAAEGFGLHGNVLWKGSGMAACRETVKVRPVDRLATKEWWRRRESNPRPKAV